ncbi:Spy/CpxP family protein refolding chaperone [Leucothrix mucor]|uniref:Spy/CpxP family protein refolding chaperone n=1 Tax=Leucothrix mucor TaxID=45248 RepID=UPI0003B4A1C3|nr:Spy/CpxP family protein refolding chaperone [Leucothrix mucor]
MKKAILVTLLASTLGLGAAAVHANDASDTRDGKGYSKHHDGKGKHAGKRGGRHGGGHMMKRMAKKLNLTEDQQAQIKSFREAQRTQHQTLREQMKELRTETQALDTSSADYQNQVAALADKKANLDRAAFIQRNEARQQFESVLTAEQRATLKEMQEKRKNRGGKRGGKHNAE